MEADGGFGDFKDTSRRPKTLSGLVSRVAGHVASCPWSWCHERKGFDPFRRRSSTRSRRSGWRLWRLRRYWPKVTPPPMPIEMVFGDGADKEGQCRQRQRLMTVWMQQAIRSKQISACCKQRFLEHFVGSSGLQEARNIKSRIEHEAIRISFWQKLSCLPLLLYFLFFPQILTRSPSIVFLKFFISQSPSHNNLAISLILYLRNRDVPLPTSSTTLKACSTRRHEKAIQNNVSQWRDTWSICKITICPSLPKRIAWKGGLSLCELTLQSCQNHEEGELGENNDEKEETDNEEESEGEGEGSEEEGSENNQEESEQEGHEDENTEEEEEEETE
ncbi:hypothetical protein MRB53_024126 [Persea americana]|uniref:Uncharacterized protein n=1 Tax=Persea americana TaxID=3435 RepID=A0ACC2LBV8_PERAE|nr:hypothetical protein MRB53_024126 [Persea americana]